MMAAPGFFVGIEPAAPAPTFAPVANIDDTWSVLTNPMPADYLLPPACLTAATGGGAAGTERRRPALSLGRRIWTWFNNMRGITGLRDNLVCGGWFVAHELHAVAGSYHSAGITVPDMVRAGWNDKDFGDAGLIDRRLRTLRDLGCTPDHVCHINDDDLMRAVFDVADARDLSAWLCHNQPSAAALARALSEAGKSDTPFGTQLERALPTPHPVAPPRSRRAPLRYPHQ